MGGIDGGTMGHIPMHIFGMSIELLQTDCICPSTHWQMQPALDWLVNNNIKITTNARIFSPFKNISKSGL